MPEHTLAQILMLPELRLLKSRISIKEGGLELFLEKVSEGEVCPKCAIYCTAVYDHRVIRVRDEPLGHRWVTLHIRKRRFSCKGCGRPFTEPVQGIHKGRRMTQRLRVAILRACERFSDLERVRKTFGCSSGALYKILYEQLELQLRKRQNPWPKVIGIDEHAFKKARKYGGTQFVSLIADYTSKRVMELVEGKTIAGLQEALKHIPGRENVRFVVMDMCDAFKGFAREFFSNATLVADKFHVLRLLNPAINRARKAITGDRRTLGVRKMLLRSRERLSSIERFCLDTWLAEHPSLHELYRYKEALHAFYRMRGKNRAAKALTAMTDKMALSIIPEVRTLRRTLMKWRDPILAYFIKRLTNGRTEGFNNLAKLVKRRAFGYRNFENYRMRVMYASTYG